MLLAFILWHVWLSNNISHAGPVWQSELYFHRLVTSSLTDFIWPWWVQSTQGYVTLQLRHFRGVKSPQVYAMLLSGDGELTHVVEAELTHAKLPVISLLCSLVVLTLRWLQTLKHFHFGLKHKLAFDAWQTAYRLEGRFAVDKRFSLFFFSLHWFSFTVFLV